MNIIFVKNQKGGAYLNKKNTALFYLIHKTKIIMGKKSWNPQPGIL